MEETNLFSFVCGVGPTDTDDYDGYAQHQQRTALPEQGRSVVAVAFGETPRCKMWAGIS